MLLEKEKLEQMAVFAIRENKNYCDIKSRKYSLYNRIHIPKSHLLQKMIELSDIFNNVLQIGIIFEIDC